MEKFVFFILNIFKNNIQNNGIDFNQLKLIVSIKLLMDKRNQIIGASLNLQNKKMSYFYQHLMIVLFGGLFGLVFLFPGNILLVMTSYHAILILFLSMTIITEFSNIILDTKDKFIILPRPINDKTYMLARLLYTVIYLAKLCFYFSIIPFIICIFKYNIYTFLLLILTTFLTTFISLIVTNIVYLVLIRNFSETKIRDIISYIQIAFAIIIYAASQILPKMTNLQNIANNVDFQWYTYLFPPVWFGVLFETIINKNVSILNLSISCIAIVMPIILYYIIQKYLSVNYIQNIIKINLSENKIVLKKPKKKYHNFILSLFVRPKELYYFNFLYSVNSRDRNFKIKFYPFFGYMIVLVFILIYNFYTDDITAIGSAKYLSMILIYIPTLFVMHVHDLLPFNEYYQAAWVFQANQINKPSHFVIGQLKYILLIYFIPAFVLLSIIGLFLFNALSGLHIFICFLNIISFYLGYLSFKKFTLPFSKEGHIDMKGISFIKRMMEFMLILLIVGLHFLFIKLNYLPLNIFWIILAITGDYFFIKILQKKQWDEFGNNAL